MACGAARGLCAGSAHGCAAAAPDLSSLAGIARSAGLGSDGKKFYVQNIDHKVEAILAGIGIGHLPRQRIQKHLDSGQLIALQAGQSSVNDSFLAWKTSHKGKGLNALTKQLTAVLG